MKVLTFLIYHYGDNRLPILYTDAACMTKVAVFEVLMILSGYFVPLCENIFPSRIVTVNCLLMVVIVVYPLPPKGLNVSWGSPTVVDLRPDLDLIRQPSHL